MSKSKSEKAERKDTLRRLSRKMPTPEEFAGLINEAQEADPRAGALIIGALLDNLLSRMLKEFFVEMSNERSAALFENPNAPLSTFSAKINLAHALSHITDEQRNQLDVIRSIRNHFAHSLFGVSYEEPLMAAECTKLSLQMLMEPGILWSWDGETETPRAIFENVGFLIGTHIIRTTHNFRALSNHWKTDSRTPSA